MPSRCGVETRHGSKFTRNLSGNARPQSSQLVEPLWTDPGLKSGISVRELISNLEEEKKRRWVMNGRTFSQNPRKRGKATAMVVVS